MRPLLLGMNNPLSPHPRHALYPSPVNCTGWRLWKMLHARTGASPEEYLETFERRNLLSARVWSRTQAREAAARFRLLEAELEGRVVVVLGEEPRQLLGLPKQLVHPVVRYGVTYRQLPHPSGRCHWYNHPTQRAVAELLLEELYVRHREGA